MIELSKPAIPLGAQDEDQITRDPSFCGVCLNLSTVVAAACLGGRENLFLFDVGQEHQVWDFRCTFADLLAGINDECASCRIIKQAIDGVFPGRATWEEDISEVSELTITMVEGNVLRIYLPDFFVKDQSKQQKVAATPNMAMIQPNASIELYCCKSRSDTISSNYSSWITKCVENVGQLLNLVYR